MQHSRFFYLALFYFQVTRNERIGELSVLGGQGAEAEDAHVLDARLAVNAVLGQHVRVGLMGAHMWMAEKKTQK